MSVRLALTCLGRPDRGAQSVGEQPFENVEFRSLLLPHEFDDSYTRSEGHRTTRLLFPGRLETAGGTEPKIDLKEGGNKNRRPIALSAARRCRLPAIRRSELCPAVL